MKLFNSIQDEFNSIIVNMDMNNFSLMVIMVIEKNDLFVLPDETTIHVSNFFYPICI